MDQYHRAVLSVEEKFFDECDTGNGKIWFYYGLCLNHYQIAVPVLVVFTKCDALWAAGFAKLKQDERKLPTEEQFILVKEYAKRMLRDSTMWERLKTRQYPPKDYVHLESECELVWCKTLHFL